MLPELKNFCVTEPDIQRGRQTGSQREGSSVGSLLLQGLLCQALELPLCSAVGVIGGCAGRAVGKFMSQIIWIEDRTSAWMDG